MGRINRDSYRVADDSIRLGALVRQAREQLREFAELPDFGPWVVLRTYLAFPFFPKDVKVFVVVYMKLGLEHGLGALKHLGLWNKT